MTNNSVLRTSARAREKERKAEETAAEKRLQEEKAKHEAEALKQREREKMEEQKREEENATKTTANAADDREMERENGEEETDPDVEFVGEITPDKPDAEINDHLQELNSGRSPEARNSEEGEEEEQEEVHGQDGLQTPPKKKSRKSKKSKKDSRKEKKAARKEWSSGKRKTPEEERGEDPEGAGDPPSTPTSLRQGRFSTAGNTPGRKASIAPKVPPHNHLHQRIFGEASKVLSAEDKHTEFTMGIRNLMKEAQKVDKYFAIVPLDERAEEPTLVEPTEVPLNHTDLGANISFAPNVSFEKRKPWGKSKEDLEEEDYIDPEVYFSFVFSCDKDPEDILDRIRQEWRKYGGNRLQLMVLKTHNPKGAVVLYHMHNGGHVDSIVAEGRMILEKARDVEQAESMGDTSFKWGEVAVPEFTLTLRVPVIPGLDTKKMDKLPWQMKNQRKALHITSDAKHVKQLQALMQIAKDRNLVEQMWGKQVKPSNVIVTKKEDKDRTRSWQINNVKSYTKRHVNYHASMTTVGFPGVWDLDKEVPFYSVTHPGQIEGYLSLRVVFYKQIKLEDGHSLIAEIHQEHAMADVEAVIPDIPAAETMVLMMEKNIVAYLTHYLEDVGMDKVFVKELLKESCDPSLFHSAAQCTWDKDKCILSTPEDKEREKEKALEDAAWYKDKFGEFMDSPKKKKGKQTYTDPENLYDLDGTHSVKSISAKPRGNNLYGGTRGAPAFRVGGDKNKKDGKATESINVDSDNEDASDPSGSSDDNLSRLSKEELIQRLRNTSVSTRHKGSAPANRSRVPHSTMNPDHEASSSSSSSSSGSSSSSSVESVGGMSGAGSG